MMGKEQVLFRNQYREKIDGWYNGYLHIAVVYTIGITAMWVYIQHISTCLLYTSPSPRDVEESRMPSSA